MKTERRFVDEQPIRDVEQRQKRKFRLPTLGVIEAMKVTLRTMLSRAVTVHYPEERIELPERTRGVIALLEENCTVCMLCSKECPCWCIYIEGHKVTTPGKRKPVNELDRFAIDYGLCMYCGICVEVCPFDALHWSPFFEYTSFTYEGMVHEREVLAGWEDHVLPPPNLVADADEKAKELQTVARDKRAEGVWAVIREADKREARKAHDMGLAGAPGSSDTPPDARPAMSAQQAPASPVPASTPDAAAPQAEAPAVPAVTQAPPQGAAVAADTGNRSGGDLGGLPRIDPTNLPDGIGPVERGRLKKLAMLQERGQTPPADLVANLKPLLDQMGG
jgi:NADH-quinone oxidoreductase subunit I